MKKEVEIKLKVDKKSFDKFIKNKDDFQFEG